MKKIILSFIFSIISFISFAQSIIYDNVYENMRVIETSHICARSFTDRVVWNFGLKGIQNNDSTIYCMIINLNTLNEITFKENGLFLIKTFNDDIIELQNIMSEHSTKTYGYTYHSPILGNIGTISSNDVHRNVAYFYISELDLQKLQAGISKVRVETSGSHYIEKIYKKDQAGEKLYNSYNLIKEGFSTTPKNIKDDF